MGLWLHCGLPIMCATSTKCNTIVNKYKLLSRLYLYNVSVTIYIWFLSTKRIFYFSDRKFPPSLVIQFLVVLLHSIKGHVCSTKDLCAWKNSLLYSILVSRRSLFLIIIDIMYTLYPISSKLTNPRAYFALLFDIST